MKTLACAKLSTPIMLKMSVRPLVSMNSSRPYTTPFNSETAISSSIGGNRCSRRTRVAAPNRPLKVTRAASLRTFHLADRRQRRGLAFHLGVRLPSEARPFGIVFHALGQRRHIERLQDLMIVRAHLDIAQRRRELHALERPCHLHG